MPLGMGIATFDGWDVDVALDLLKRNSGIGWDPGRFAVLLRGGNVRRLGSPAGAPIVGGLYSVTAWREKDQEGHSVY